MEQVLFLNQASSNFKIFKSLEFEKFISFPPDGLFKAKFSRVNFDLIFVFFAAVQPSSGHAKFTNFILNIYLVFFHENHYNGRPIRYGLFTSI